MADLMTLAEEERTDLLTLLHDLTPAQWQASSLCSSWTVRDVVVHAVSYDALSAPATLVTFARGRLRVASVNELALRRYEHLDTNGVIDLVAGHLRPRGLSAGFRGGIALTDGTIHHQDIRRAIGLPRTIPEHRLRRVLDFSLNAPTLPTRKNRRGLRLIATDVDWRVGDGLEVVGPGEALLMAAAGRPHALRDLSGQGKQVLAPRLKAPEQAAS